MAHKVKELEKTNDDMWEKLGKDFTVKNMPAYSRFSATSYEGLTTARKDRQSPHATAKSTGMVIVGAGIVIVFALFYLAYRFLILPAMEKPAPIIIPEEKTKMETPESPVVPIETVVSSTTVVETVASGTEIIPKTEPEAVIPAAADADNDGLSDAAELLLGTNPQMADSDNDSYADRAELLSGYDPLGAGKLTENRKIALYAPAGSSFALIYPSAWEVNMVNESATLFSAPDQSFIQMSYEDLEEDFVDILAWYRHQFSDTDSLKAERFIDSNFGPGILSADGQIAYFLGPEGRRVYVLSYIKSGETAPYLEIFRMMAVTLMKI